MDAAIKEEVDECLREIKTLEKFISLSIRRENLSGELENLHKEAEGVRELMARARQVMATRVHEVNAAYERTMQQMCTLQSQILRHILQERRRKVDDASAERTRMETLLNEDSAITQKGVVRLNIPLSARKDLSQDFRSLQLRQLPVTPKLTIPEYKESPMVKRVQINPIPFCFQEFEVQISPDLFATIPKYMRGRESITELNAFLETIITPCFNEKYQLVHRKQTTIRNRQDMELWRLYNEQISYIPGRHFITEGDISRKIKKEIPKKMRNQLVMLRHISFLKEQRVAQTVCFIWCASGI